MNDLVYAGYRIKLSNFLSKKVQKNFPRSKKRRIRNKWAKRDCNYFSKPDDQVYIMEENKEMVMHPSVWAKMQKSLEKDDSHFRYPTKESVYMPFMDFPIMGVR